MDLFADLDDVYEEVQYRGPKVVKPSRKPKLQPEEVVHRTDEDWKAIFPRYPTCDDGFVQSFNVDDPDWLDVLDKYGVVVVRLTSLYWL